MKDLTFGEQVKIILNRKGMTIKELAEQIQEETGKAMSRQNLTQRLGRDNFQEQDMRMIAKILGCPFRLSIFPIENDEEFNIDEAALMNYMKKANKKKKVEQDEEVYQQEFVFDETMTASVAEMQEQLEPAEEEIEEEAAEEIEEVVEEEIEEEAAEELEEVVEEEIEEAAEEIEEVAEKEIEEEATEEQKETVEVSKEAPEQKERFRGGLFFRGFGRNKKNKKADKKVDHTYEVKPEVEEIKLESQNEVETEIPEVETEVSEIEPDVKEEVEVTEVEKKVIEVENLLDENQTVEAVISEAEEFEPIVKHNEETEDLSIGELNPYTGREYQTNSVRMHPSKIGYVQVYDRTKHGWIDMTEWAFLGYQEKKKKQLGRYYEPPIYLD